MRGLRHCALSIHGSRTLTTHFESATMFPVTFFRSTLALSLFALGAHAAQAAPDGATMTVSAGAAYVPEYAGSDQQRVRPVIALDYQNASGFFASTARGIGYITMLDGFRLSGALAYAAGRSDSERTFGAGSTAPAPTRCSTPCAPSTRPA